jgi:futalosine hydrolase
MKLLIVSATKFEIRPLADKITLIRQENEFLTHFRHQKVDVDILVTGIGMTATAYHTGRQFLRSAYDLAINTGICGSFESTVKIGEVVEITEENFCELGAENNEQFLTLFDLGLIDPDEAPYSAGKLINPARSGFPSIAALRKVRGTTANTIHGKTESIEKIKKLFHPEVESMEGGAFFFSCLASSVPFHQVRSISNYVKERDKSKWDMNLALKNLNATILNLLKEII